MANQKWQYKEGDTISIEVAAERRGRPVLRAIHLSHSGVANIKNIIEFYADEAPYACRKFCIQLRRITKGREHLNAYLPK
jgi:hypothetical protein